MPLRQYFINLKKGDTVTINNSSYRVQDDGKGHHLHIIKKTKEKRVKLSLKELQKKYSFPPGSYEDWIFNRWFQQYDYPTYQSFASAEIAWLNEKNWQ